jgi:hypothetical protein
MDTQKVNGAPAAALESGAHAPSILDSIVAAQDARRQEVASRYKPVMGIEETIERHRLLNRFVSEILVQGIDYGTVPGTERPALLKPGAEKLCAFFGYSPAYSCQSIEDWAGVQFGEPLFYYRYTCTLSKDGAPVGQGEGSASTWESKYRYRNAGRKCPDCGQSAIGKSKDEWGGGWYCNAKRGGCGSKYKPGTPGARSIESQQVGRVANPDFADVINTVQKMGQKRAYVAATLSATGASQYFTQDVEDMPGFMPNDAAPEHDREKTTSEIRHEAHQIDTGGAPVGTAEAARNVAAAKIAAAAGASAHRLNPNDWKGMMARFEEMQRLLGERYSKILREEFNVTAANQLGAMTRFQAAYDRMVAAAKGGQ